MSILDYLLSFYSPILLFVNVNGTTLPHGASALLNDLKATKLDVLFSDQSGVRKFTSGRQP